ncbi:MAG: hypothetical protein SVG88_03195 [Halobacteriales archaeon]|nr:hypothetical protein [Halobacteriales archaeon]
MTENDGQQFDRLPSTAADRTVEGRATREAVLDWWTDRYGVPVSVFESFTFWEKGAGKLWVLRGDTASPTRIEALGMRILHTRQEHWKPTTNAVQRFGGHATHNVIELDRPAASRFVAGEDQAIEWDGDWGYLIVSTSVGDATTPIGVGLYLRGELRSQIPKSRRRDLDAQPD